MLTRSCRVPASGRGKCGIPVRADNGAGRSLARIAGLIPTSSVSEPDGRPSGEGRTVHPDPIAKTICWCRTVDGVLQSKNFSPEVCVSYMIAGGSEIHVHPSPPFISESGKEELGTPICSYVVAFNFLANRIISRPCLDASPRHTDALSLFLSHTTSRGWQGLSRESLPRTQMEPPKFPAPAPHPKCYLGRFGLWVAFAFRVQLSLTRPRAKTPLNKPFPREGLGGDPVGSCSRGWGLVLVTSLSASLLQSASEDPVQIRSEPLGF